MIVAVEILTGEIFIEADVEPRRAVDHPAEFVVNRCRASVVARAGRVCRRPERNLIAVPELAFERLSALRIRAAGDGVVNGRSNPWRGLLRDAPSTERGRRCASNESCECQATQAGHA